MSDTPIIDSAVTGNSDPTQDEYEDLASAGRQLERDLAAVTDERDELRTQLEQMDDERLSWKTEASMLRDAVAELRRDKERLEHLFANAWLPSEGEPMVISDRGVLFCVGDWVELDDEGYRDAIDAAMQEDES